MPRDHAFHALPPPPRTGPRVAPPGGGRRPEQVVATAREPADLVAVIPYLLGFQPVESLVVAALEGPRRRLGPLARVDLADVPAGRLDDPGARSEVELVASRVCQLAARHGWDAVVVVVYTERRAVADAHAAVLLPGLAAGGTRVVEMLGASGERWWTHGCAAERCCPPEGVPFDPSANPLAATAVAAGLGKAATRDELRALLDPAPAADRRQVGLAVEREQATARSSREQTVVLVREVGKVIDGAPLDLARTARLLALVQHGAPREAAWGLITRPTAHLHAALWQHVARLAPDPLLPPAGCLAGFASWLDGVGVVAAHAADRVAEVAPAYPLNDLLRQVLAAGVDPRDWDSR